MVDPRIEKLETPRLRARPLRTGDEPLLAQVLKDEQAAGTVGGLRTDEEIAALLGRLLWHWRTHGFGAWALEERATAEPVGYAGLVFTKVSGELEVEVMYALGRRHWGKGLATEIAGELVSTAFDRLGLSGLVSYTIPENRPSRRVMEKLGFCFEREVTYAGEPHVLYRLAAPRAAREPGSRSGQGRRIPARCARAA